MTAAEGVVVGLDVGTTSVKAVGFDADGGELAAADVEYPTSHPRPGHAEQDPDEVADAVVGVLRTVAEQLRTTGRSVAAVSLSTAMHSLIGLDADGRPLTGMLTFADSRAAAQATALRREHGQAIYRRTGTPLHAMSPLVKLRWFREESPEVFGAVSRWVSGKEYVLARLHDGPPVVDHSVASATGLLNLEAAEWDDGALELAGIDRSRLSSPVPTRHVLDGLRADTAQATTLPRDTAVVVGASDGALANLGVGAIRPGMAAATLGTSGAVRLITGQPATDPDGRTFCYILTADGGDEDRYLVGGAITNGGSVLAWLRDALLGAGGREVEALIELATEVPPGADGLVMLPWLDGERAPRWRSGLTGALLGLRSDHTEAHVVRAAMEGVLLQLRLVVDAVRDTTGGIDSIRATGGFRRSGLWSQLMADVIGQRIDFTEATQAAALGAAVLGMDAIGLTDGLDAAVDLVAVESSLEPRTGQEATYRRLSRTYARLAERFVDSGMVDALTELRSDLNP